MKIECIVATGALDSSGDKILLSGVKFPESVPVLKDFSTHPKDYLGTAEVSCTSESVNAKLEIQGNVLDLTPAIGFRMIKSHMSMGIRVIEEVEIKYVGLSASPNVDDRIKSIRQQLDK